MNNFNQNTSDNNISDNIDNPLTWVEEHYLIASFINSLANIQENPDNNVDDDDEFQYNESGKLIINNQLKNKLKANYSEANWRYVENCFLG
jgi:hypothetical protein